MFAERNFLSEIFCHLVAVLSDLVGCLYITVHRIVIIGLKNWMTVETAETNRLFCNTSRRTIEVIRRVTLWRWAFSFVAVVPAVVPPVAQNEDRLANTIALTLEVVFRIAYMTQAVKFVAAVSTAVVTAAHLVVRSTTVVSTIEMLAGHAEW